MSAPPLSPVALSRLLAEALQSPRAYPRRVVRAYLTALDLVPADLAGDPDFLAGQPVDNLARVWRLAHDGAPLPLYV